MNLWSSENRSLLLLGGFFIAQFSVSFGKEQTSNLWLEDWETTLESARETKRPILIAALGTDWSVASKKLKADLLDSAEFLSFAKDHLILYQLKSNSPPLHAKKISGTLQAMTIYLEIETIPTVILIGQDGTEWLRHGFIEIDPKTYVESLGSLIE